MSKRRYEIKRILCHHETKKRQIKRARAGDANEESVLGTSPSIVFLSSYFPTRVTVIHHENASSSWTSLQKTTLELFLIVSEDNEFHVKSSDHLVCSLSKLTRGSRGRFRSDDASSRVRFLSSFPTSSNATVNGFFSRPRTKTLKTLGRGFARDEKLPHKNATLH